MSNSVRGNNNGIPRPLRISSDLRLLGYNLLIILISPWLLKKRIPKWSRRQNKHADKFAVQRWTCPVFRGKETPRDVNHGSGSHVVFAAFGYGQVRQIAQLTSALKEEKPDIQVTWALAKPMAVRRVREAYPEQAVTFIPFDFITPTANWLRRLSPDVVVLFERSWYPNLIRCSVAWGAKVVLASGVRQTYDSSLFLMPLPMRRWVAGGFSTMCFQNAEYLREIEEFVPKTVDTRVVGNIKFDCRPIEKPVVEQELSVWLQDSHDLPLLGAGSTGPEDEAFVLRAFEIVRSQAPCKLLLAPRRMRRLHEVIEMLAAGELKISRRTEPASEADVYVLDTMGELALAYRFCAAAFIGGTIGGAGHDVIEPLVWGVPVFFGVGKRQAGLGQKETEDAGVGFRVRSPEELAEHWLHIVQDETLRDGLREKARRLLSEQSGTLARNVAAITEQLDA